MLLRDLEIARRSMRYGMINPFCHEQVRHRDEQPVISYGLSSYGYDIRLADEFKVFTNIHNAHVDPKAFSSANFIEVIAAVPVIIPPNSFALGRSLERIKMPRDLLAICLGKSTYARCGIVVNVTPLEPEWEGYVTIEISNTTPNPALVYPLEGICQLIFLRAEDPCGVSYQDRKGKYQNQEGVVTPRV